jgi:hypothetical protein
MAGDIGTAGGAARAPTVASAPQAHAARGNCGRKRTGRSIAVRMIVRRQGGGKDKHKRRFIRYHVHFQTKGFARSYADVTRLRVAYRLPNGKAHIGGDSSLSKLLRANPRFDYAHTTIHAKPGSRIHFRGHTDFKPPVPIGNNEYLTGDGYRGSCRAR